MYTLIFTKQALKDIEHLKQAKLSPKTKRLLDILKLNPFLNPPPYEKLSGDLKGLYSRRINIRHRLVYEVFEQENLIKIIRLWTHYE